MVASDRSVEKAYSRQSELSQEFVLLCCSSRPISPPGLLCGAGITRGLPAILSGDLDNLNNPPVLTFARTNSVVINNIAILCQAGDPGNLLVGCL
jgi:hypothetical protein